MKNVIISPNKIKLIENTLGFLTDGSWKYRIIGYLEQYDDNQLITDKSVITIKHISGELLALDGNKLSFAGRLVRKNVQCLILEEENDKNSLDNAIYNSQLIWKKSIDDLANSDHFDFFGTPKAAWIYDIPSVYAEELSNFGIEFKAEQMMFRP